MTTIDSGLREELVQRVRAALAPHADIREANMFGVLAFLVDGKMAVAAGRDGSILVRSRPADYDELTQRGAEPARMGDDKPMGKGWLRVPAAQIESDDELSFWVGIGLAARPARK